MNGKIVLEPEYDGIITSNSTDIILIKDEKFGNYNIPSNKIIQPKHKSILNPIGENLYLVNDSNYGLIDKEGNVLLPVEYNNIQFWSDSTVLVERENIFKVIDVYSKKISHEFNSYKTLLNGKHKIIQISSDNGIGILSNTYGMILKPNYDEIRMIDYDKKTYFNGLQSIEEAKLLVNLLVDDQGKIIINQALNLDIRANFSCELN